MRNRLTVSFECKGAIKKFFNRDKFIVEYDTSIQEVPEEILLIPFLAAISPLAWANQTEIIVKTVDATYLSSLSKVRETLQKFYPQIRFIERIQPENVISPSVEASTKKLLLFSGGLDALTTFIRHRDENPILVSVHHAHFSEDTDNHAQNDERANISFRNLDNFSQVAKTENRSIVTNWIYVFDHFWLRLYVTKLSGENWYRRIMHGMTLCGLCAPLAYIEKANKIYIASSFTAEAQIPWGSHPDIDNNIEWTGTKVEHDSYELSRQEKIFLIADYLKSNPGVVIAACNQELNNVGTGKNCSRCEKCSRTILGLELAGVDPNNHGFSVDAETFAYIKKSLQEHTWRFGDDEVFMWTDLKKHASNNREFAHHEAKVLIDWLKDTDIASLRGKPDRSRRADLFFRLLPYPIFKLAEKIYMKLF